MPPVLDAAAAPQYTPLAPRPNGQMRLSVLLNLLPLDLSLLLLLLNLHLLIVGHLVLAELR